VLDVARSRKEPGQIYFLHTRKVRARKDGTSKTFIYHYDLQGNLISETKENGRPIRDYIWANNIPLAQIKVRRTKKGVLRQKQLLYLHTDHLNTPRLATDENQIVVWRWEADAFGRTKPDKDPDRDGTKVNVRLRFAGQYYDSETGLHYNYFRYYDPSTGRYTTSDPIGLRGALNTFAYVGGNPLRYLDLLGLEITGQWDGFDPSVTDWEYTGLTPHLERGPGGRDLVDRIGYFNFLVSGTLGVRVKCKETDDCGNVKREWTLDGSVAVNDLKFRVPYDEPAIPIPGMGYVIWADKVWRVSQYLYEWRGMIELAGKALLNTPTLICKGQSFLK